MPEFSITNRRGALEAAWLVRNVPAHALREALQATIVAGQQPYPLNVARRLQRAGLVAPLPSIEQLEAAAPDRAEREAAARERALAKLAELRARRG